MKNIITSLSVAIVLFVSCSPSTEKKEKKVDSTEIKENSVSTPAPVKDTTSKSEVPGDLSSLVPVDLLDSKSTNVYEKYGLEFSGNCYSCDLASLSVTKKKIIWTNVCDEKDTFEINDFSFTNEGNKTILKTPEGTYIVTKIDKAPVYEVVLEGQKLEMKNKRISRYFTTKKALSLFKEHDCGDFEG
ncbi:hypothetical protein C1637_15150 [Chryseobacterium lactis]|uniref:Copper resistance protein NlpE n=1 Tax=Chryseobacterium lactis TaxID=1241981 RepID=A0A3G6RJ88_CHRLC|nr:hypothetical protein [Chryseobacterium lactis]AZA83548.1 hypothetical protein EG342_17415 [Chryseobacterium lactis]AZB03933.1 hypothetical protein EG341_08290 [Chryseobacterium lactis]PNW13158.1 hypothetical protein C1637_15150 [Chryseobacterium lactis]